MPPQPRPRIFRVSEAAALIPGVLTEAGSGRGDGAIGSSLANAAEKLTPETIVSTRARKAGGLGNTESSVRRMADRWMALATWGVGPPLRLSPRNQDTESSATAEKEAPALLSIWLFSGSASSRSRIGSQTQ